jgi:hypothetical protein
MKKLYEQGKMYLIYMGVSLKKTEVYYTKCFI